jgi:Tol biopolymer transport system component
LQPELHVTSGFVCSTVRALYGGRDQDPDWSPNGKTIAFERDIEPIDENILQVFVMNVDGSDPTPLTALPSENGHPGWGRGQPALP